MRTSVSAIAVSGLVLGLTTGVASAAPAHLVATVDVTSVAPNAGPLSGGKTITILGDGFTGATAVRFSSTPAASYTVVNSTKITAVTPAHAAGPTYVNVTAGGLRSRSSAQNRYTYAPAPTITSVTPNEGPAAGGQTVTIIGTNFTGATNVKIKDSLATNLDVVNSTKITATTPAGPVQKVNVYVFTPSGKNAVTAGSKYTYRAAATG